MDYEDIIKTVYSVINNEDIISDGLTLEYEVDIETHRNIDRELYNRVNNTTVGFEHQDKVEVFIDGITVRFVTKQEDI